MQRFQLEKHKMYQWMKRRLLMNKELYEGENQLGKYRRNRIPKGCRNPNCKLCRNIKKVYPNLQSLQDKRSKLSFLEQLKEGGLK